MKNTRTGWIWGLAMVWNALAIGSVLLGDNQSGTSRTVTLFFLLFVDVVFAFFWMGARRGRRAGSGQFSSKPHRLALVDDLTPEDWGGAYGVVASADSAGSWRDVQRLYMEDHLEMAYDSAQSLGAGPLGLGLHTFRMIEAEHRVRTLGNRLSTEPWLHLEWLPDELIRPVEELCTLIRHACEEVSTDFAFAMRPNVCVTIFSRESDVPWVPGRHGYCVHKTPYHKICLPAYLTDDPEQFTSAVRHEFAHVMTHERSAGRCPRWLDEAVAMVASREPAPRGLGPAGWFKVSELGPAFLEDRESEQGRRIVASAYVQSHVLGIFLVSLQGVASLGRLCDAFADNSFGQELAIRLRGERFEEEALNQVYDLSLEEVFSQAREWAARSWTMRS